MFLLNSNEPMKVTHLQKLANQSIFNGGLMIEIVRQFLQWKYEKIWSFDKAGTS